MYRYHEQQEEFVEFYLPFGGKLSPENRWVRWAQMVPWEEVEKAYAEHFSGEAMGAPAKSARIALGALLIKERLSISDEETVEQIRENPYLQYFLGLHEYRSERLFDPSMMVHFRARFSQSQLSRINEAISLQGMGKPKEAEQGQRDPPPPCSGAEDSTPEVSKRAKEEKGNQGKLLIDATCAPADITYPTDLKLLNEAREKTEQIIDLLYRPWKGKMKKPRTYRQKARKLYLETAKTKKRSRLKLRSAIGKQLRFIRRNLKHINTLVEKGSSLERLSAYQYKGLLVIGTLYEQQREMYEQRTHRVEDRIVSLSQAHVRPMVRGKAGAKVEFGAKISVSSVDGYTFMDHLSWDSFNESAELISQVQAYRQRFGHYPASVHADKIYRTRANRAWCRERAIRLSGPPLGRPPKVLDAQAKKQTKADERDRIPIEGKLGNAKRKGTLARIMAKLPHTSATVIHLTLIMLNLEKWLNLYAFILRATKDCCGPLIVMARLLWQRMHHYVFDLDDRTSFSHFDLVQRRME